MLSKAKYKTLKQSKATSKLATKRISQKYIMEDQVGFLLRLANQRHTSIFSAQITGRITPTQFAALTKLYQVIQCSQNQLGRLTAMDAPTIKGVIDRLSTRGLVEIVVDANDRRRRSISLSRQGRELIERAFPIAAKITKLTLSPLPHRDQMEFVRMLRVIGMSEREP